MYLDFIISNDDLEEGKLDPLSFVVALDNFNIFTAQGFVVENSPCVTKTGYPLLQIG
jgi:hypothetical protein